MAATGAENPFRVPGFEDDGMGLFSDQMADLDPSVLQPGPYYGTQFEIELNNGLQHPTGKAALQPVAALQHVIKPLVDLLESWDARILELTVQYVRVLFGCIGKPLTFYRNQRLTERVQQAESKFESKMQLLSQAWSEHYQGVKTSIFVPMMQLKREVAKWRDPERDHRQARYTRSSNQN